MSTPALDHRVGDHRAGALTACADPTSQAPPDMGSAMAMMREHGLRVSAARRLVLEALLVADGPMSAEQIAQGIGGRVPSSDIASVYRNLQAFHDIGLVRHVHLGHGPGLHVLAMDGRREFLTCERCADYRAVAPEELAAVRELIERNFGYHASFAHFPIVGLCPDCARAVNDPQNWLAPHP
ncbi:MAG TPA: transcriptional repressor [Solirubrobacteraceae bacterium]|nr:transcriptional repressor [Solirubrobacteraceae bacterium]